MAKKRESGVRVPIPIIVGIGFIIVIVLFLLLVRSGDSGVKSKVCGTHTETYTSSAAGCDKMSNCECLHKSWAGLGSCDSCECERQVSNC